MDSDKCLKSTDKEEFINSCFFLFHINNVVQDVLLYLINYLKF